MCTDLGKDTAGALNSNWQRSQVDNGVWPIHAYATPKKYQHVYRRPNAHATMTTKAQKQHLHGRQ